MTAAESICRLTGTEARMVASSAPATNTPATPPATTIEDSTSSAAMVRPRLAPSALITANSPWRADARANSRCAAFTQAITSTRSTAPSNSDSSVR